MKRWHLPTLAPSSDKQHEREPRPDAPRTATVGRSKPRVLFSEPECRAVVIDLRAGEEMGDHAVHERAVIEVVSRPTRVRSPAQAKPPTATQGTLINLEPGEHHARPRTRRLTVAPSARTMAGPGAQRRRRGGRPASPPAQRGRAVGRRAAGITAPANAASGVERFRTDKWMRDPIGELRRAVHPWVMLQELHGLTQNSVHAFDITGARGRLCAAEGGYEIVHESRLLQICVYALVAPEPDWQRVNADDKLYVVVEGTGCSTSAASSSSFAKGTPRSSPPAPFTSSAHMSTSLSSRSSESDRVGCLDGGRYRKCVLTASSGTFNSDPRPVGSLSINPSRSHPSRPAGASRRLERATRKGVIS